MEQLRNGIRPWMRPWESGAEGDYEGAGLPLRDTGQSYSGINVLVLWAAAAAAGYLKPTWMTFNQAKRHGGRVRKGEKGQSVVYADQYTRKTLDPETGQENVRRQGFHKTFTVFNVDQIDGLDPRWHRTYAELHPVNRDRRSRDLDRFFLDLGIDVRHGGDEAYYVMADDYIQMPPYELFHDAQAYYTTLAHESVHWTRHASRLNRTFRGSDQVPYAKEELVAEIGSAFLSAELGMAPVIRDDHADYIGAWLRVLEDDSKAIFRAASQASKAVAWLLDQAGRRAAGESRHLPQKDEPPVSTWVQESFFRSVAENGRGWILRPMSLRLSEAMGTTFPIIAIGTRVEKEIGDRACETGEIVALDGDDAIVHWHTGERTERMARAVLPDLVVADGEP